MSEFSNAFDASLGVAQSVMGESFTYGASQYQAISIEAAGESLQAIPGGLLNAGDVGLVVSLAVYTTAALAPEKMIVVRGSNFRIDQVVNSGISERTLVCRPAGVKMPRF